MPENKRLIAKKEEWARKGRGLLEDGVFRDTRQRSSRLPPGQHMAKGWPVLDLGIQPSIPLAEWELSITGCIEQPTVWNWNALLEQPQVKLVSDFHCVTTWSTFDNEWEGVRFSDLVSVVSQKLRRLMYFLYHMTITQQTYLLLHVWTKESFLLELGMVNRCRLNMEDHCE